MTRIVIIGGGPAGYEAALVAAQHGAEVTVVERDGGWGLCAHDCVPSKTFIASAGVRVDLRHAAELGVSGDPTAPASTCGRQRPGPGPRAGPVGRHRPGERAASESSPARPRSRRRSRPRPPRRCSPPTAATRTPADVVLIATGATPRVLAGGRPDGERILTWRQVYDLPELPEHLVVVGSGVTGAEFARRTWRWACGHAGLQPRPGDAARGRRRRRGAGGRVPRPRHDDPGARPRRVGRRDGDGVLVTLAGGRTVTGSHALMAVGSVPNTADLGLE